MCRSMTLIPIGVHFYDYMCVSARYVTEVFLKQDEMHSKLQSLFIAQQLFSMFEVLDFADEVGRYGI